MMTSSEFYNEHSNLKAKILNALIETLNEHHGGEVDLDELGLTSGGFEDESNNYIVKVDTEKVYFDGGAMEYPLSELGILDALYLLSELE